MSNLNAVLEMGIGNVILTVVALMFVVKEVITLGSDLAAKFGLTTKAVLKEQKQEERLSVLEEHDKRQYESLNEMKEQMNESFAEIKKMMEQEKQERIEQVKASCRPTLYQLYLNGEKRGYITQGELESFTALADIYLEANGNATFKKKIIPEFYALPIVSETDFLETHQKEWRGKNDKKVH